MQGRLLSPCHKKSLVWGLVATTATEVTNQFLFTSLLFIFPYNFLGYSPLRLKFSMLSLCLRRALDSHILGGRVQRAVTVIIFPSLLWQRQWDNICKMAWKSSSRKSWVQLTAGRTWLRQAYKHAKTIESNLNSKDLHGKWCGTAPDQDSIPAQVMPVLICGLFHFPGVILRMGMGQGDGTSPCYCCEWSCS